MARISLKKQKGAHFEQLVQRPTENGTVAGVDLFLPGFPASCNDVYLIEFLFTFGCKAASHKDASAKRFLI